MKRALNYNEKKVQKGQAEVLHAGNFLQLPQELNFYDKLQRFEQQMELNHRAETKTLHVSLNFHPSETTNLTKEKLTELANEYMRRIGFGDQPYLVYQHHDAGHPHLHIVTTTIQENGKRIPTHELGRKVSAPATRQLEKDHGLISAAKQEKKLELHRERAVNSGKVEYGKSDSRRAITNVLDVVIDRYKYRSLAELNAVLKLYNVMADRGKEDSRTFKNRGLYYRIIDGNGNKIGVPIKASSIYSKPTLAYLDEKFTANELKRTPDLNRLKAAIDFTLLKKPRSLDGLVKALEKERVSVSVRRSSDGKVYGLTYIDHQTRAVCNGSDLGKEYAAKRMLEKLAIGQVNERAPEQKKERKFTQAKQQTPSDNPIMKGLSKMIEQVIEPEETGSSLAQELREELKRKRKRNQQSNEQ